MRQRPTPAIPTYDQNIQCTVAYGVHPDANHPLIPLSHKVTLGNLRASHTGERDHVVVTQRT